VIYGIYQSAAGMMVNEYRQSVLANNLANADTVGFKRDVATFAERVPASRAGVRRGPSSRDLQALSGGLWLGTTHTDHSEGPVVQTDHPLDVALEGPGFLRVGGGDGALLTRDGRMMMDADGWLVSVTDGAPVLGRGGQQIRLNPRGGEATIDTDGKVVQDGGIRGWLALVDVKDYAALEKVGASRFAAPEGSLTSSPAYVHAGYVEGSGSRPIAELVDLMEASRAYQINAEMVSLQDQSLGRLINVIARI
jgi:flagellar basal-body rod protein FlgG